MRGQIWFRLALAALLGASAGWWLWHKPQEPATAASATQLAAPSAASALASTSALRENAEQAMEHLEHAIELNNRNRYLAQNDPDFSSLSEDPRFTELLYPEKPV